MADIDAKAPALSAARHRILQLQEQMTDKILQMAAEVEKLMDVVPMSEAKAFLKARCNLPCCRAVDLRGICEDLEGIGGSPSKDSCFLSRDEGPRLSGRRCPEGNP